MKKLFVLFGILAFVNLSHAAGPEGFQVWKGATGRKADKELAGKRDEQKFAWHRSELTTMI